MKPKPNSVKCAKLNACGFEQVNGLHYGEQDISASVMNGTTIRMVFVMTISATWTPELLNVKGSFLNGRCSIVADEDIVWSETSSNTVLERATESLPLHGVQK
eukprot:2924344-Ditylum_brightwellii.AAC.1